MSSRITTAPARDHARAFGLHARQRGDALHVQRRHALDGGRDLLHRKLAQVHKARVVRLQLVDQRHERGDGAAHRDQALGALKVAGQALKIGGELLACPRGGGRKLVRPHGGSAEKNRSVTRRQPMSSERVPSSAKTPRSGA